ncbi:histidine--tRNA ligase [Maridesulfovibrio hydrothermalis]|uniref:Histidine--tRNA ligase n=1 Tax=Maridesulfovibrio hydrothermalis AM13 = DSM 14728 TaxID=1121451 RepID=L0R9H0_9BACT|nr:histidine--tRNA ligase [Maridesulfovibrio hydrothermalis]CCO22862.1 histidyl-tRNA synthetase [Maridesulfovibrio hydrothermalis AM13 = DSM 14728]
MAKIQKIKGVADLFPEDSARYAFMEKAGRDVFSAYGFGELRTPILEKTELFCRSIGEETDVVQKEMYTFPDRKGRSLTMRPEATAGVVRAYVENKIYQPGKVSKFFTFGPMFRYERPQAGRMRQFHQINAEVFGASEPQADAEVLLMLSNFLKEIGLEKLSFELNSLGCPECRPVYRKALDDFFNGIDKEQLCDDCQRRVATNPLRVLDCKNKKCKELTVDAPSIPDHLCQECRDHFDVVITLINEAGLEYTLNPRLVRGLDYYQRTTFEVTSGDIGAQTAVAGGGRYDGLVESLGGAKKVPGIGFACGMERLAMLMDGKFEAAMDFYVALVDERSAKDALIFAEKLRRTGLKGEVGFVAKSMKAQLRHANKIAAKKCFIFGSDEFENGTVTVKDMTEDGGQQVLPRDEYFK